MLITLKKIFELFNKEEKHQIYWLLTAVIIRSLVEVAGVASIMPFIAVAANPESIFSNTYLLWAYDSFGFQSARAFLLALGFGVFGVLLLNNSLAAYTDWKLLKFTYMRGHSLAQRLFARYLSQPYAYYLDRNTSELGANVLSEVGNFMKGVLRPFMEIISKLLVSIFLFSLLFAIDPVLALIVGTALGTAFSLIFVTVRKKIGKIGKERALHNRKQFLYLNESLSGIKDIKVKNCEGFFHKTFSFHSYKVNISQALYQIFSQMPKYALELISFGGILLITIYFLVSQEDTTNTIPLLALYAFAGYRLMPALQGVFVGITTVRYNLPILDRLSEDLNFDKYPHKDIENWEVDAPPLFLTDKLELKDICYSYPKASKTVLESVDLTIEASTIVGFVGTTGAGKTTLVDIILGLLEPQGGKMLVDDQLLDKGNIRSWQKNIGYVPQEIFLSDESIKHNIALGISPEDIDEKAITKAAMISDLHDFIIDELPNGYDTIVGERGVRLSGGQRQRIGIARAIYHDPGLIIFDEATSSLDNITEKNVLKSINKIKNTKTILMIAHRLTTLKECDVIYVISEGRIIDQGSFDDLLDRCPIFQDLAKVKQS